jgi:hypothetical protein
MTRNANVVQKSIRIFSTAGSIVRVKVPVTLKPAVSVGSLKCCCSD